MERDIGVPLPRCPKIGLHGHCNVSLGAILSSNRFDLLNAEENCSFDLTILSMFC